MEKNNLDHKRLTLNALRKLRINDLMINYGFNALDLALFNNRNDRDTPLSHHIRDIRAENLFEFSDEEISHRAIPYVTKFLKKNDEEIQLEILTVIQGYFGAYTYDKLTSENDVSEDELIEDLSQLLNKDKYFVKNMMDKISGFNSTDMIPHNQTLSQLEQIFRWYWQDKEHAREKFIEYKNHLDNKVNISLDMLLTDVKPNDVFLVEEGGRTNITIQWRRRSRQLVTKAREYFKNEDKEGTLRCMICGYVKPDFVDREIVHIHHMEPLKDIPEEGITALIEDAIKKTMPLCPTCHSVVHANEDISIDQIIEYLHH